MIVSCNWLQEYFEDELPVPQDLADVLTMHAYEVEGVDDVDGDTLLDIDILPNRAADSLSHIGVAREVATLAGLAPEFPLENAQTDDEISTADTINLSVDDASVRRATKRLVVDVEVGETPDVIKKRLERLGQRSINNIVDITNYVMLETGQPVHAFDYEKIAGEIKNITVRAAVEGEAIETLDGEEHELEEGMLVIADDEKALDIAGIKGGAISGIDESTSKVVLSVCSFDPTKIRTTSQKLNLRTDASKRFENNPSPELPMVAMERLSQLIGEHAGGRIAQDVLDEYPRPAHEYVTGVSVDEVNELLGTDLDEKDVSNILEKLHFEYEIVAPLETVVNEARQYEGVPYERGASVTYDAPEKFDCSSFTSFLYSRAGVSIPRISVDQFIYGVSVDEEDAEPGDVVFYNSGEGDIYHESQEYLPGSKTEEGVDHCALYLGDGRVIDASSSEGKVVVDDVDADRLGKQVGIRRMSKGSSRFRVTVPYWRQDIRKPVDLIEEIGRVYGYENIEPTIPEPIHEAPVNKTFYYTHKIRDILVDEGFSEVYTYSFVRDGDVELENPVAEDKKYLRTNLSDNFAEAVEENEKYKELLGQENIRIFEIGTVFSDEEEHLSLAIASTQDGDVKDAFNRVATELDIDSLDESGSIGEVNLDKLIDNLPTPESYDSLADDIYPEGQYQAFSRFPHVLRDIAVWVPEGLSAKEVEEIIKEEAGELLVNSRLFDEYDPDDREQTSYAFRLVFQSHEKTLSDEEVNEIMDHVYETLDEKEGWEIR